MSPEQREVETGELVGGTVADTLVPSVGEQAAGNVDVDNAGGADVEGFIPVVLVIDGLILLSSVIAVVGWFIPSVQQWIDRWSTSGGRR